MSDFKAKMHQNRCKVVTYTRTDTHTHKYAQTYGRTRRSILNHASPTDSGGIITAVLLLSVNYYYY